MKPNEVTDLLNKAGERHTELSQLLYYAPFVFDEEKHKALVSIIRDELDSLSVKANLFSFEPDNPEVLSSIEQLKEYLDSGDDAFSPRMYDDIEEARLYKKRFKTPMDALREASNVYQIPMDSAFL